MIFFMAASFSMRHRKNDRRRDPKAFPSTFERIEPSDVVEGLASLLPLRLLFIIAHRQQCDNLVFARDLEKFARLPHVKPADPARAEPEFLRLKDEVLAGDADIDHVEGNLLDLSAEPVGQEIEPSQDENENRGFGRETAAGINPGKGFFGESGLKIRLIEDKESPGLGILGRRGQARRFKAGRDFCAFDRFGKIAPDAPPASDELLERCHAHDVIAHLIKRTADAKIPARQRPMTIRRAWFVLILPPSVRTRPTSNFFLYTKIKINMI
jgi:hypothetical protein